MLPRLLAILLLLGCAGCSMVRFPGLFPPREPLEYGPNQPMLVLLAEEGADSPFLTAPSPDAEKARLPSWWTPAFLDSLLVYHEENGFYLVKHVDSAHGEAWGWIGKDLVLDRPKAMPGTKGGGSGALGAIPIMGWRARDPQGALVLRKGRGDAFQRVGRVALLEPKWVYKMATGDDGRQYVLLGNSRWINYFSPARSILGWVPRDGVILTENRLGVFYDAGSGRGRPALIFRTRQAAEAWRSTGRYREEDLVGRENLDHGRELAAADPRFPVLEYDDDLRLMRIACITSSRATGNGDFPFVGEGGWRPIPGLQGAASGRVTDILFIIDGTVSMRRHFPAVQKGVMEFMRSLPSGAKADYRFGLDIYRDYCDAADGYHPVVSFGQAYTQFLSALDASRARRVRCDATWEEAVMQGLARGVEHAAWGEGHNRIVVLVGDHGNHVGDRRYDEKAAARALRKHGVFLYTINVNPNLRPAMNALFDDQMRQVIGLNLGMGKRRIIKRSDAKATTEGVAAALEETTWRSKGGGPGSGYRGGSELAARYATFPTARVLESILERRGRDMLRALPQLCETGWVARYSPTAGDKGKQQFKPWFMISRRGQDQLTSILGAVLDNVVNGRGRLDALFEGEVRQIVGTSVRATESFGAFLRRCFDLPPTGTPDVFALTVEEMDRRFGDPGQEAFKRRFIKEVGKRYTMMRLIRAQKTFEGLAWDAKRQVWEPEAVEKFEWFQEDEQGDSYAWLPLEMLP